MNNHNHNHNEPRLDKTPVAEIINARKSYYISEMDVPALRCIDLAVRRGEFLAIMPIRLRQACAREPDRIVRVKGWGACLRDSTNLRPEIQKIRDPTTWIPHILFYRLISLPVQVLCCHAVRISSMVASDREFRECVGGLKLIAAENMFCQCFWSEWMRVGQGNARVKEISVGSFWNWILKMPEGNGLVTPQLMLQRHLY